MKTREDSISLKVKVIPASGCIAVKDYQSGEVIIRLKEQATQGKANKELLRYMSKVLAIPQTSIAILLGENSRHKVLTFPKSTENKIQQFLSQFK